MSSKVKIREIDFMANQSENDSLRVRMREIEDENQELRAQNLIQNRTIVELRHELVLLRLQLNEMADTSALLTERVRSLTQNTSSPSENDRNIGQITAPPLLPPPPVPPPLPIPPARIRISPRQVGAGEALTTPLGISLSSPPRHRIKRDCRQGFYRSVRSPYRRFESTEPGPSTPAQFLSADRPNYFVGLRIIPQFQTSFICSQSQSSGYSDSASDSSGSDENLQLFKKVKTKSSEGESAFRKCPSISNDFELLKNVKNFHNSKIRPSFLENYNLALPNTNSKFFFPLPWNRKNRENSTLPSTSGNDVTVSQHTNTIGNNHIQANGLRNVSKISDCVQYTFPTIHEGLHHNRMQADVTTIGQPSRMRKLKKNIPYLRTNEVKLFDVTKNKLEDEELEKFMNAKPQKDFITSGVDSESFSSVEEQGRTRIPTSVLTGEISSDFEQDGFQADESSNCLTSDENSLEKICISDSNMEKKS